MNKIKYHIGKNKKVSELLLYRTLTIFLKELKPKILNIQKDIKITFGYRILNSTFDLIKLIKNSYETPDYVQKLKIIKQFVDILGEIELEIKMLYELENISLNQIAILSVHIGNMMEQIDKWKTYIDNKMKNKNDANLEIK